MNIAIEQERDRSRKEAIREKIMALGADVCGLVGCCLIRNTETDLL